MQFICIAKKCKRDFRLIIDMYLFMYLLRVPMGVYEPKIMKGLMPEKTSFTQNATV